MILYIILFNFFILISQREIKIKKVIFYASKYINFFTCGKKIDIILYIKSSL